MGEGSEVFVLDMGEPVRIMDLARNMITLAGLVPGEDIEIAISGLRPGEKMFEEIQLDGEDVLPTHHEKIRRFQSQGPGSEAMREWLERLQVLLASGDAQSLKLHLARYVPEYQGQLPGRAQFQEQNIAAEVS
jgi:FlaA1/EpsC-like NDP-sugar epimerase